MPHRRDEIGPQQITARGVKEMPALGISAAVSRIVEQNRIVRPDLIIILEIGGDHPGVESVLANLTNRNAIPVDLVRGRGPIRWNDAGPHRIQDPDEVFFVRF